MGLYVAVRVREEEVLQPGEGGRPPVLWRRAILVLSDALANKNKIQENEAESCGTERQKEPEAFFRWVFGNIPEHGHHWSNALWSRETGLEENTREHGG